MVSGCPAPLTCVKPDRFRLAAKVSPVDNSRSGRDAADPQSPSPAYAGEKRRRRAHLKPESSPSKDADTPWHMNKGIQVRNTCTFLKSPSCTSTYWTLMSTPHGDVQAQDQPNHVHFLASRWSAARACMSPGSCWGSC